MMACISYIENDDISENKKIFIYGFKHNKTDKIDNYFLNAWESDQIYKNDKLFNFCSNKIYN